MHRPRRWDAVTVVDAPSVEGSEAHFVVLADGTCVAETGDEPDLIPFVDALELEPPYRAEAVRREGSAWAVGARGILVVELHESLPGDELELVWDGAERSMRVGGAPTLASVPELETLAASRFDTWVVRAQRLRGASWEVEIGPL